MGVIIGIRRRLGSDEYKVYWKEDEKYDENKAYYTPDLEDAVSTAVKMIETARVQGLQVQLSGAQFTTRLISIYRPGFLIDEIKKCIEGTI